MKAWVPIPQHLAYGLALGDVQGFHHVVVRGGQEGRVVGGRTEFFAEAEWQLVVDGTGTPADGRVIDTFRLPVPRTGLTAADRQRAINVLEARRLVLIAEWERCLAFDLVLSEAASLWRLPDHEALDPSGLEPEELADVIEVLAEGQVAPVLDEEFRAAQPEVDGFLASLFAAGLAELDRRGIDLQTLERLVPSLSQQSVNAIRVSVRF